jgi:hypothetical protein
VRPARQRPNVHETAARLDAAVMAPSPTCCPPPRALLMDRLGLEEDELLQVLGRTPSPWWRATGRQPQHADPARAHGGGRGARARGRAAAVGAHGGTAGRPLDHLLPGLRGLRGRGRDPRGPAASSSARRR